MSLDLKPVQYLEMLKAEYGEYKKTPLSMREGNNLLRALERNAGDHLRRVWVYGAPKSSRR
jgi:hypothetical protein